MNVYIECDIISYIQCRKTSCIYDLYNGVIYWEPAWVSSSCSTQWGLGSHQEHAAFFDFDNNLLSPGGIDWMNYNYNISTSKKSESKVGQIQILSNSFTGEIIIKQHSAKPQHLEYLITDSLGNVVGEGQSMEREIQFILTDVPHGVYIIDVMINGISQKTKNMDFGKG